MERYGIGEDEADYNTAIIAALIKRALSGNVNAIQALYTITGDDPLVQVRQGELKLKQAELKEKQRQFDLTREDRRAMESNDEELAASWLDAVIATDNGQGAD